jgi:hypothetical protein
MRDVSIIIPVYIRTDEELEWLDECVESAIKQDCEVVVYNDGSPVDPYDLLTKYPVIYEHGLRKHGAAHARNEATKLATKDLILPLDCDDRLVDGAVDKLLSVWDGEVPVYPDISKFGDEYIEHYVLLDWDCDNIFRYVGFSSVNVLHKREYWQVLGGWNEHLEFYEDGEYNARLFSQWCGVRYPEPLVEYRQHATQRTKIYRQQSAAYARMVLAQSRRLTMACKGCGGKKRAVVTGAATVRNPGAPQRVMTVEEAIAMASTMPGEVDGRVLAVYVGGKGQGKHYYKGPKTKYPYKVVHGQNVYVDEEDTDEKTTGSLFHKVEGQKAEPEKVEKKAEPERKARVSPEREPVEIEVVEVPDVYDLTTKQVKELELDHDTALLMLKAEKRGKNRKEISAYLEKLVKA